MYEPFRLSKWDTYDSISGGDRRERRLAEENAGVVNSVTDPTKVPTTDACYLKI